MTMPGIRSRMLSAAGGGGSISALTFVTSGTSTSRNVAIPASATAGDLAVVFDTAYDFHSVGSVTPAGWSTAEDRAFSGGVSIRMKVNYKVLHMLAAELIENTGKFIFDLNSIAQEGVEYKITGFTGACCIYRIK